MQSCYKKNLQTKTKNRGQQKKFATHNIWLFLQPITISSERAGRSRMVPGPIESENSYYINKLERAEKARATVKWCRIQ